MDREIFYIYMHTTNYIYIFIYVCIAYNFRGQIFFVKMQKFGERIEKKLIICSDSC